MRGMSLTVVTAILIFESWTLAWPYQRPLGFNQQYQGLDVVSNNIWHLGDRVYGVPDNETGERVSKWNKQMKVNPEELGSYAEGDILFPIGQGRNGLIALSSRWPDGVIPYVIDEGFSEEYKQVIYDAINDYHAYTCIRFTPYQGETDYIRIKTDSSGCWSSVGRIGGGQTVNLQVPGCVIKKGTVIHELMHAVGFLHEQSRYERDNYVSIQWHNIYKEYIKNFDKASKDTTDAFGVSYDYGSVMHYSAYAFSKNNRATIVPRRYTDAVLGQREGFSSSDILKIQKMYGCNSDTTITLQDAPSFFNFFSIIWH